MKIYFAGSIRGGRDDRGLYLSIIEHLKKYGEVLTEHIGDSELKSTGEDNITDVKIHNRDMKWVLDSDILIAEVTKPSLGVGYEIGRGIENNKNVICLYRQEDEKTLSAMIAGSPDIITKKYSNIQEVKKIIDLLFK